MSQENAEIVRRGLAAINETYQTGDMVPWRQMVKEAFDPEIVLEAGTEAFTEGEWRGHEGAVGFVANQMDVLEGMWMRLDEFTEVDEDCLVVAITFGGRARESAIEVEMHPIHVFRMRAGKIVRWQVFLEREQALEAAGLAG
jgi:ketosteroid isomerase-like protein